MIEEILGPGVSAAEAFDDLADVVPLQEEEAVVAKAVRWGVRDRPRMRPKALAALGQPSTQIMSGYRGAPQGPPDVVGNIPAA